MAGAIEAMAPLSAILRPRRYDDLIVRAAAREVAAACVEWAGEGEPDDWIDDLLKCRHDWDDGYRLAKALEQRCYVDADAALVEVLDEAGYALSTAHEAAVRQWVKIVGFTPEYSVGDIVKCRWGVGPIHSIRLETAQYVVASNDREWHGVGGYVINAEDVEPASGIEAGTDETPSAAQPVGQEPGPEGETPNA